MTGGGQVLAPAKPFVHHSRHIIHIGTTRHLGWAYSDLDFWWKNSEYKFDFDIAGWT